MRFPVAVALKREASLDEIERAIQHWLDTVIVPVDPNNWRKTLNLMNLVSESGWQVGFVLWAEGAKVKNMPLHKFANQALLAGWLIQDVRDPLLIAMLRATTEVGNVWSWQKLEPFATGTLSPKPDGGNWWAWISVNEPESLETQIANALLEGAEGICFSSLPSEVDLKGKELAKAIGFFAVHLRLWKPLLSQRKKFSEAWEIRTKEIEGWIWILENKDSLCLFKTLSPSPLAIKLPFVAEEGARCYSVRFPALFRLPMQRKGEFTIIKLNNPQWVNLIWLTGDLEQVQGMHYHTNELTPKAMQFSVQWALARRERFTCEGKQRSNLDAQIWSMLKEAKQRNFSRGYLTACQILSSLGALSSTWTSFTQQP